MATVSIIVPVYKVEKYLDKCIESIISQTYKDLEIILVDDGSPDNCGGICDEYATKDSRIRVIHKENGGLSDARNAGLNIATGEYIMFVDSDDYITENMVEILYNKIQSDKSDMAVCSYEWVDEVGEAIEEHIGESPVENECISSYDILEKLCGNKGWYYVIASAKLYKKSLFEDIRFPKGKVHEDAFIIHRIMDKCDKISCVEDLMYKYVQRTDSIMGKGISIKRLDDTEAYIERCKFLLEKNYVELAWRTAITAINTYQVYYLGIEKTKENKKVIKQTEQRIRQMCVALLKKEISVKRKIYLVATALRVQRVYKKIKLAKDIYSVIFKTKTRKRRIFLMYTPTYPNMGDHAIMYGEERFFKKYFPNSKLIKVNDFISRSGRIRKAVKREDLIAITGGGFLGDLWIQAENDFKAMIQSFPNNKVIAMPNTAYYSETENGKKLLEKDRKFYAEHKNVMFFLRDKRSYDLMTELVGGERCRYLPDMALMLKPEFNLERKNILICTRGDHETVHSKEEFEKLKNILEGKGYTVSYTDTVKNVNSKFAKNKKMRERYMEDVLREFASAKLIITERLHGMVLSAITKTPCIAVDNVSKKVSGVYAWIDYLDYIEVTDFENINADMAERLMNTNPEFDTSKLAIHFDDMAKQIKEYWD